MKLSQIQEAKYAGRVDIEQTKLFKMMKHSGVKYSVGADDGLLGIALDEMREKKWDKLKSKISKITGLDAEIETYEPYFGDGHGKKGPSYGGALLIDLTTLKDIRLLDHTTLLAVVYDYGAEYWTDE